MRLPLTRRRPRVRVLHLAVTRGRRLALIITLLTALTVGVAACGQGDGTEFDSAEQLTKEFFPHDLALRSGGSFGVERSRVREPHDARFGEALKVIYPEDSASEKSAEEDGTEHGGAQFYLRRREGPTDSLHLRYYVRFAKGFDFVKGGKLPGLYGGTATAGREIPDGEDGFSTRYMWRADGAGEVYAYLPTSKEHGTSLGRGAWTFPTGRWVCIEQQVKLNTPGRQDGVVTVWLDGRQVFHAANLTFRTTDALRIEGLFFSTFFGGGNRSWATPRTQSVEFAAFAQSPSYIGPLRG